MAGISADSVLQ